MKVKGLLIMPGTEVKKVRIPASIKFIKSIIGEELIKIKISESVLMFINKKPNIEDFNRFYRQNIILGKFVIVGTRKNKIVSLKKRSLKRYYNLFKLCKHKRKIDMCKQKFLADYYEIQMKQRQKAIKENKERIFKVAA